MGKAAAKKGDKLKVGTFTHTLTVNSTPPVQTAYPCDFSVAISAETSSNVWVNGSAAAIANGQNESGGTHPTLDPLSSTGTWDKQLLDSGNITGGSGTVFFSGSKAVRHDDTASCCGTNNASGTVVVANAGSANVFIGG